MTSLKLSETVSQSASEIAAFASSLKSGALSSTLRLGVTGLSRSGKTVFITALVNALTQANASSALSKFELGSGFQAYLEPQPDLSIARFCYEDHHQSLTQPEQEWPQSTRHVSQLRITLEWDGTSGASGLFGLKERLHIDIIDYPGEWLLDLAMLNQSYRDWSNTIVRQLRERHKEKASAFLDFIDKVENSTSGQMMVSPTDQHAVEQHAIKGAELFTNALTTIRQDANAQAILGPGRFLWPGDLAGAPQVTFFPMPNETITTHDHDSKKNVPLSIEPLETLLTERFRAYQDNVVKPFFIEHFSRLDRQIVLTDVLSPLNRGANALRDLEDALQNILQVFRTGRNSWLSFFTGPRIDKILFAATKADHIHSSNQAKLENVLRHAVSRARERAEDLGAEIDFVAMASLKATTDITAESDGTRYACIRGLPEKGETIGGRTYDGHTPAVIFPGDLPINTLDVFEPEFTGIQDYEFVRFRPPQDIKIDESDPNQTSFGNTGAVSPKPWPHIGLEKVLSFLIGDRLT